MRKSLWAAWICMGLALAGIPFACCLADSGKERIRIREEALRGDPKAASGIAFRVASHWNGHLLWDTEYAVGQGEKSEFTFSPGGVKWIREDRRMARMDSLYGSGSGICQGDRWEMYGDISPRDLPYPEAVSAVAERARAGEVYAETVKIGDYYEYYPLSFEISGCSVTYSGDQEEETAFLSGLFHIGTAQDKLSLTLEKDAAGALISSSGQAQQGQDAVRIADASAFGEAGIYYAFACGDAETGKRADRGENAGIFFLPFREEDDVISLRLSHMEKLCDLPRDAVPAGMLLDQEEGCLYLTVLQESGYRLLAYRMEGGELAAWQDIALGRTWGEPGDSAETPAAQGAREREDEAPASAVRLGAMTFEEGGLLMTWEDNGFAFVAREGEGHRLWCSGRFPLYPGWEEDWPGEGMLPKRPFPGERQCLFDGERLALAAFGTWEGLDVLLAVYGEEGERYCGLYRHSGEADPGQAYSYLDKIGPQGDTTWGYFWDRDGRPIYVLGTEEPIKPLEFLR